MTKEQEDLKARFLEPEVRDGVEVSAELKAAWKVMLDMLEEFIRICEKHNLKYCLDGGSVIGAIRHKGFIPWDDDIDISLPRPDFQRFLGIAQKELKSPYFLQYGTTDPEHSQAYACIRNNATSAIDVLWTRYGKRFSMGIGLDIFPFDYVPESKAKLNGMLWRNKQILRLYNYVFSHTLTGWRKWVVRPVFVILYRLIGPARLIRWRDRNFAAYTAEAAPRYGNLVLCLGHERAIFPKELFATRVKVPFEYIDAYVPGGYEEYLAHAYGANWRTPIRGTGNRVGSHEPLVIDATRPYKELLVERFGYKKEWVEKLP